MENYDWDKFFEIYAKSKYGKSAFRDELNRIVGDLHFNNILTDKLGYTISKKGIIQHFFQNLRISEKGVAHDVVDILRKKDGTNNYSVIEMYTIIK